MSEKTIQACCLIIGLFSGETLQEGWGQNLAARPGRKQVWWQQRQDIYRNGSFLAKS
jgi:hypothetical protein